MKVRAAAIAGMILGASLSGAPARAEVRWLPGNAQSCAAACAAAGGYLPIVAGTYSGDGGRFYVCRANADDQGLKPGWNIAPKYPTVCSVASSGREQHLTPYDCLCDR